MTKYEYEVVRIKHNRKQELNRLGGQGWKLVSICGRTFYFIRETRGNK